MQQVSIPFTIITTCRSRGETLRKALPSWIAIGPKEIIIVDSLSTQELPVPIVMPPACAVRVVQDLEPQFSLARLRNCGAKASTTDWLLFLDADIALNSSFSRDLENIFQQEAYGVISLREKVPVDGLGGLLVCMKAHFQRLGGYDETFGAYGSEDSDIINRFEILRVPREHVGWQSVRHFSHPATIDHRTPRQAEVLKR